MSEMPRYRITLEATPQAEPPEIRLRRALKYLWRALGLRALKVEDVTDPETEEKEIDGGIS